MLTLTNQDHLRIYVDTLQALARDAHYQGNAAACDFIRAYLVVADICCKCEKMPG